MTEIKNLTLVYPDDTKPIEDFSLEIASGDSIALIGANGAGKTSLLLSLVGIIPPASGSIVVEGTVLSKNTIDDVRSKVGLVFQNPDDQLFMPVLKQDIAFGPLNFGKTREEAENITAEVMEKLCITQLGEKSPTKMSGGEKRMGAVATVLAMNPQLMLFDEPTAFLDPGSRRRLINVIKSLPQSKIIATHDLTFACEVCQRVVIIKKGKIAAVGKPKELLYDNELMQSCGMEAIGYME